MTPSRRTFLASAVLAPAILAAPLGPAKGASPKLTGKLAIRRFAWAGISLQVDDATLFIDARSPDPESGAPGPALESSTPRSFALATHHHGDHCDLNALKPVLGERGYLVVQEDTARLLDSRLVPIQPVRLYDPVILSRQKGEFVAWAVPASDGLGSPQVSWVVESKGKRIIHCGDTGWHGHWWNIARAYGPFDAAFLPINGYRQTGGIFESVKNPMGMTPEQAVEAGSILKARLLVPIHFGNTDSSPSYVEEARSLDRFLKAAAGAGIAVNNLAPGAVLSL